MIIYIFFILIVFVKKIVVIILIIMQTNFTWLFVIIIKSRCPLWYCDLNALSSSTRNNVLQVEEQYGVNMEDQDNYPMEEDNNNNVVQDNGINQFIQDFFGDENNDKSFVMMNMF